MPDDKLFVQDMFPTPRVRTLVIPSAHRTTDIMPAISRWWARNMLHALRFDAFGLPPSMRGTNRRHIRVVPGPKPTSSAFAGRLGFGHDSRRSFSTTDVDFWVDSVDLPTDTTRGSTPQPIRRARYQSWSPNSESPRVQRVCDGGRDWKPN